MNNIIKISDFRKKKRRAFMLKHNARIDRFVADFLSRHVPMDYLELSERYIAMRRQNQELAWDYHDFRDLLAEAMEEFLGEALKTELGRQSWFRNHQVSFQEILDRCVSSYVLGEWALVKE